MFTVSYIFTFGAQKFHATVFYWILTAEQLHSMFIWGFYCEMLNTEWICNALGFVGSIKQLCGLGSNCRKIDLDTFWIQVSVFRWTKMI